MRGNRRVAWTRLVVDGVLVTVSTVHVIFDHQYSDGPPLIFETMVFGIADYEPHWRYSTEEEAKLGHQRVVELLRSGVQDGLGVADRQSKQPMRYTVTMPISQLAPISASSSGSGWPWWAWVLPLIAAMALAAASLLVPRNRWFGRVERWAFWRRESVRERVRDRRDLVYVYAGLFAGVAAVLVVWPLPSLLTRHPRVDAAARHTAITNTRTGLVATLAVLGAGVGLALDARHD